MGEVKRKALYFTAPRRVELREETLPALGADDLLVETTCSAISAGTEMLVYQGHFPRDLETDSVISGLRGGFKYPLTLPVYLLIVYLGLFAVEFLLHHVHSLGDFAAFAFQYKAQINLIAVYAINLISVLIVPAVYVASRKIDPKHSGFIAAGLAAFNLLFVHFGHHPRPHVPS